MKAKTSILRDQFAGVAVNQLNDARDAAKDLAMEARDKLLTEALERVDGVRAWLADPSTLLGSAGSKHGELAEVVEVEIRNARSIIDGNEATATFANTGRTGAVDYFIDGQAFQSKFYASIPNGLSAFVDHMEKYPELAREGGLMFPADKFEIVKRVLEGDETLDLNNKSRNAIIAWVERIEELSGRNFDEAVTPSISTYSEVQLGVADQTLDAHADDIEDIHKDHLERIEAEHGPSWAGAAQAAAVGGAVSALITTGMTIYSKAKDGRNLFRGEFTTEDWKDLGWSGAKGFGSGAISGAAIYGMTNYAGMAAPFAASVVSATKGLSALTGEYAAGNIDSSEFFDLGLCLCAESAVVGMATAAGQMIIPIPILGGVIGSISGKMMLQLAQGIDAKQQAALKAEVDSFNSMLDETYQRVIDEINEEFDKLGKLTEAAFDFGRNYGLMLSTSVSLAAAYGVPNELILTTIDEVDAFMLG